MKLTESMLRKIIKEEVQAVLNEEEKKKQHHVVLEPDGSVSSVNANKAARFIVGQLEANAATPGSKVITADRNKIRDAILQKKTGQVKFEYFQSPPLIFLKNYLVYIPK